MVAKNSPKKEQAEQCSSRVSSMHLVTSCSRHGQIVAPDELVGPKGFTTPLCKIDLRPGRRFFTTACDHRGSRLLRQRCYREFVPLERIVCMDSFADRRQRSPGHVLRHECRLPSGNASDSYVRRNRRQDEANLQHNLGSVPASERDLCQQVGGESLDKLRWRPANA